MRQAAADPFKGNDRFAVTRRIGQGAMGVVYEVHDHLRQMPVALKTVRSGDPNALYRFKREFRSLSNITHRNLATLYELFADATPWFFTMELVNGVTFLEYVRPSGSAAYQRLSAALTELVTGLSALHSCKKLHRDVKPSNVLVQADGRVVVLDFGLVMDLDAGSLGTFTERDWFGTLAYMAPEQVTGDVLTAAADWYGVGGLLFQALTGNLPFTGDPQAILGAKLAGDGPSPRELNPETPEALDRLCTLLLRRDPEERPSGQQIVDLLAPRLSRHASDGAAGPPGTSDCACWTGATPCGARGRV